MKLQLPQMSGGKNLAPDNLVSMSDVVYMLNYM